MPPARRRPSLAELAAAVGMSTATVSHVFNRPERVAAATRERVLAVAEQLGYSGPNPVGRQLRRGRSDALGMVFTDDLRLPFEDPAAARFMAGLSEACASAGLSLLLIPAGPPTRGAAVGHVDRAAVDGFVVYSVAEGDPHLASVLRRRQPTVVVDSPADAAGADWVGSDDRAGARTLGQHLVDQGHERLGVICVRLGPTPNLGPAPAGRWHHGTFPVTVQRLHGLTDALQLRHPGTELVVEERYDNTIDSGADAFDALLDRHPDLTAVCCLSDQLALGALRAAARRGLTVPDDISVTGYDGIPEAARVGLTTVTQPLVDKGRTAGELFLTSAGAGAPRRRVLPTRLDVRATSGPPSRR